MIDTVYIRTNANKATGLGHLMRMGHLAKEFRKTGCKVSFILGSPNHEINNILDSFDINFVSENKPITSENEDAVKSLEIIKNGSNCMVILDDYHLGIKWEQMIKDHGIVLVVFDDMGERKHNCDFLIDYKWCGEEATKERYKELVPSNCQRLLGPSYCILHEDYRKGRTVSNEMEFNIMISMGGGGDLALIADLINQLLLLTNENDNFFTLRPVVGPLSSNSDLIFKIASKDQRVKPITNACSLFPFYAETSLFVGALGTSLYELASLSIPALTFSLVPNQKNEINDLEDFGNYLHLSDGEYKETKLLAQFIWTLRNQPERIFALRKENKIRIDGFGTQRIVNELMAIKEVQIDTTSISIDRNQSTTHKYTDLGQDIYIRRVVDSDINHYLESINLPQNRKNMYEVSKLNRLSHYNWWFNSQVDHYLVKNKELESLYIWHKKREFENRFYWIGGWFVCDAATPFNITVAALKWQLNETRRADSNATWIAIIKKSNKFVRQLNKFMGFQDVDKSDIEHDAIMEILKNPSKEEYFFMKYSLN